MSRRDKQICAVLPAFAALYACEGAQSALDPAGPQAGLIWDLGWLMLGVCGVVYVLVLLALALALRAGRRAAMDRPEQNERRLQTVVGAAVTATLIILLGLLTASVWTGSRMSAFGETAELTIEITGHQWWWEVEYADPEVSRRFTTANEVHIPVGRPVRITLSSADVIHSFWVPNLHGKRDLIPGYPGEIRIQADEAEVFRGQCAEFCGYQHAHMALLLAAEPPAQFLAWSDLQRQTSKVAANEAERRGQQVFLQSACIMCHTIRGTPAAATVGPDLTHLASRRTIAAGALPNARNDLAHWITDPQSVKPGSQMPPISLDGEPLQDLLSYLQSLQ